MDSPTLEKSMVPDGGCSVVSESRRFDLEGLWMRRLLGLSVVQVINAAIGLGSKRHARRGVTV